MNGATAGIAAKGMIEGIVVAIEVIVAADGADGGVDDAEEEATAAGIRADGICRRRSMHRRKENGAATTTGARPIVAIAPLDLRAPWNREKTILCCRASRWRSIVDGHNRQQQNRPRSTKSGNPTSNSPSRDQHLGHRHQAADRGDSQEACRIGYWPITSLRGNPPLRSISRKLALRRQERNRM